MRKLCRWSLAAIPQSRSGGDSRSLIPVALGREIPNFLFLKAVHWVDFRDPDNYRRAFYLLLCGLEGRPPGVDRRLEGEIRIPPSHQDRMRRQLLQRMKSTLWKISSVSHFPTKHHQFSHHRSIPTLATTPSFHRLFARKCRFLRKTRY